MAETMPTLLLPRILCAMFWTSVLLCTDTARSNPVTARGESAKKYLEQFGYLSEPPEGSSSLVTPDTMTRAVKHFQKYANLAQTGIMDSVTIEKMNSPRCGVKDIDSESGRRRRKRYTHQGSKWTGRLITYRISKYPTGIRSRRSVNAAIERAFKFWGDTTNLTFFRVSDGRKDIDIRFERGSHGHRGAFDGPGYTLAHAFYPEFGGAVHFDDEENWTLDQSGTNLLQVATHEFGHSLGLDHSHRGDAIMTPFYKYRGNFQLNPDDVYGIKTLYGLFGGNQQEHEPDTQDGVPNLCQDPSIDAITHAKNGDIFVFKGDYYWRILVDGIAYGYPRKISDDWVYDNGRGNAGTLPGNIDACYTWGMVDTYCFKGSEFWIFQSQNAHGQYLFPRSISPVFPRIPNNIQAAFAWNHSAHFFKGSDYWLYTTHVPERVRDIYPLKISDVWPGLPNDIDAVFQTNMEDKIYFFKGDKYWKFTSFDDRTSNHGLNGMERKVLSPGYPKLTREHWFGCTSSRSISDRVEKVNSVDP